jgi:hypothetical protein
MFFTFLIALTLVGCGRRGTPSPPGPAQDVIYPHPYPAN